MKEFEQIVNSAGKIAVGLLLALIISRAYYYLRTRQRRVPVLTESLAFRGFRVGLFLSLPFFFYGLLHYLFVLQKGSMFASEGLKWAFTAIFAVFLAAELYYSLRPVPRPANRIFNMLFFLFSLGLGFLTTQAFLQANTYPAVEDSVTIELPFEGEWVATGAGATGLTNHHDRIPSQKYAVDMAKIGENGKLFTGEGVANEDSHTFGARILSPVDGNVVHLLDSLPDVRITERDKLAGNHLVIRFRDSLYVALAHLQQGSIRVKIGDAVRTGDELGLAGNSGNTDFPHLHLHIQDTPQYDIKATRTYPLRFKRARRKRFLSWKEVENTYLLRNYRVRK